MKKTVPETKMARAYRLVTAFRVKWPEASLNEACKAVKVERHQYNNYLHSGHLKKAKVKNVTTDTRLTQALDEYEGRSMAAVTAKDLSELHASGLISWLPEEAKKAEPQDILSVAGRLSEALREVQKLKIELKDML